MTSERVETIHHGILSLREVAHKIDLVELDLAHRGVDRVDK